MAVIFSQKLGEPFALLLLLPVSEGDDDEASPEDRFSKRSFCSRSCKNLGEDAGPCVQVAEPVLDFVCGTSVWKAKVVDEFGDAANRAQADIAMLNEAALLVESTDRFILSNRLVKNLEHQAADSSLSIFSVWHRLIRHVAMSHGRD